MYIAKFYINKVEPNNYQTCIAFSNIAEYSEAIDNYISQGLIMVVEKSE